MAARAYAGIRRKVSRQKIFSVLQPTLAAKKLRKRVTSRKGASPNPQASISKFESYAAALRVEAHRSRVYPRSSR